MKKREYSILLVEDHLELAKNIIEYFEAKGVSTDYAQNGQQALDLVQNNYYDLIILDLTLPKIDGLDVCNSIRQYGNRHIPIIMLTARDSIDDKVIGFQTGADDYLTKPFNIKELDVRCEALMRIFDSDFKVVIELGPLKVNKREHQVTLNGDVISLSTMGFKILTILAESYPKVVSRSELAFKLWGSSPTESDALKSHMYQLRKALELPTGKKIVKTVHGVGFTLDI